MAVDPMTLILAALASGSAIVQAKTNKAVEEVYAKLKTLIQSKFRGNSEAIFVLDKYAEKPDIWQAPLKDELIRVKADKDKEIIETARTLVSLQESQQQIDYEHIAAEANHMREQLLEMNHQLHNQFEQWFRVSLAAAILGLLGIIVGLTVIFVKDISIGVVISIASFVPEFAAALFF